jgi:hypothetical protein
MSHSERGQDIKDDVSPTGKGSKWKTKLYVLIVKKRYRIMSLLTMHRKGKVLLNAP